MNWQQYEPEHPTIEECYQAMVKLRDYLEEQGLEYRVFDSRDLNPTDGPAFIKSMCDFGGLPYKETMINTKVGFIFIDKLQHNILRK